MNTLRQSIAEYLALRRSLGFKMNDAGRALADFATFMERRRAAYITQALALKWAQIPQHTLPSHWASRLCHVRQFARYRSASDPRTQIPAPGLLPFKPKRARPYLYTDEQIRKLLHATLHMPLSPRHRRICALLPWVYYCLFGLLTVSGLRIGEARHLKLEDVDLKAGVLTVRGSKHGQDRWVPDVFGAHNFATPQVAIRHSHDQGLGEVEIVLRYDRPPSETTLPMPARRPDPSVADQISVPTSWF